MHLAGVGASPSSDSLALSHLGDDSWWHLPLVPRPPGSEAITVVNQTELHHSFSENSYTQKTKKKRKQRVLAGVSTYHCTTYLFGVYTSLTYRSLTPVTTCWLLHQILQLPTAMLSLFSGNHRIKSPWAVWGSWFFRRNHRETPKKTNKQKCKKIWRLCFFLKICPISM